MSALIIILIIIAVGGVLAALARGLYYFASTNNATQSGEELDQLHLKQNQMMFARVKWQAIAIILVVVLGSIAAASSS